MSLAAMLGLSSEAKADDALLPGDMQIRRIGPSLTYRMQANISQLSSDFANQLGNLALGLVDMEVDLRAKTARLGFGGGDPNAFRLRIDSDVVMRGRHARVQARVDLAVAGKQLAFEVPEFDMSSEKVAGQQAFQISLPLLKTSF